MWVSLQNGIEGQLFLLPVWACDYDLLFSTSAGNSLGKSAVQTNLL